MIDGLPARITYSALLHTMPGPASAMWPTTPLLADISGFAECFEAIQAFAEGNLQQLEQRFQAPPDAGFEALPTLDELLAEHVPTPTADGASSAAVSADCGTKCERTARFWTLRAGIDALVCCALHLH